MQFGKFIPNTKLSRLSRTNATRDWSLLQGDVKKSFLSDYFLHPVCSSVTRVIPFELRKIRSTCAEYKQPEEKKERSTS